MAFALGLRKLHAWRLLLAVLIALVPVVCPSCARADRHIEVGMSVRLMDADPATFSRVFDLMSQMGVTWVRADFDWSAIEGERGRFNWAYPDHIVAEASARGMKVLAVLDYTPGWARPAGTSSHTPPDNVAEYADFARAAAARYGPVRVAAWEIWNEPNISDFWEPVPDADRYAELFRAGAAAIRSVDPNALILTGGLTRGTDKRDGTRISQTTYLAKLYANGTAQLADAIAIHPYSFPWLPTQSDPALVGGFDDLPALHRLMTRYGDGDKQIWVTEFGAPTGTGSEAVSDTDQALAVTQARKRMRSWGWAGPLIYFELRDGGTNPAAAEQNFGVALRDLTLKPSGEALMP